MAGRRSAEIPRDFLKILHYRPQIHEVLNSAQSPQVSGDFAEFLPIGRNSPEPLSSAVELARRAVADPPMFFQDFLTTLHNRPLIHEVRNSGISPQVGGEFAEILPTGRNSATTRLLRGKRTGIPPA